MNNKPSFLENLGYSVAARLLSIGCVIVLSLAAIGLGTLADRTGIEAIRVFGAVLFFGGLALSFFGPKEVFTRMAEDPSLSFGMSVLHTWYHWLLYLAFIPVIGPLLQRFVARKNNANPFVSDDKKA